LKKRILAMLMAVIMVTTTTLTGVVPAQAARTRAGSDDADKYVMLDGEWNFKLYRTYANMYQYFAYMPAMTAGTWTDAEAAVYPEDGAWQAWETVSLPADDPETGGLLPTDVDGEKFFPSWAEAWVVREFDLPADFTEDDTVTLLLGIVDDNDVVYINGTPVAASGFVDGNGQAIIEVPENGGFVYTGDKADQVKWSKSYWEIQREYEIPTDVLNLGETNEIAIRVYNNNGFGGFYSGNIYALCGNELAVRSLKGLPTQIADSPEVEGVVAEQIAALESGDMEAYAATIADNYHNDADDKADKVAAMEALISGASDVQISDSNVAIYVDDNDDDYYWYSADRVIIADGQVIFDETVELCFELTGYTAVERGNWNRCYGTSYDSELFDQELTYSVYLPPSYYEDPEAEYPTVWLLHGRASSSTSYRDVDNIGTFMDEQIDAGNIMEMVLIMPDSGKYAFYEDSEYTGDKDNNGPWLTQLTEELREVVESEYRLIADPAFRGLSGNSMGAYGSIMAGTSRPDLYSSIGLHMGHLPNAALASLKSLNMVPYIHEGYVARFQSVSDYFQRSMDLQDPAVRADLFNPIRPIRTKDQSNPSTYYGPDSVSKCSLVADGCIIEGEVENSILFRGVIVEKGAKVSNSVLMQGTVVKAGASLSYVISDKNVKVNEGRMLMGHSTYPLAIAKGSVV